MARVVDSNKTNWCTNAMGEAPKKVVPFSQHWTTRVTLPGFHSYGTPSHAQKNYSSLLASGTGTLLH
jgi:hypothetical protein